MRRAQFGRCLSCRDTTSQNSSQARGLSLNKAQSRTLGQLGAAMLAAILGPVAVIVMGALPAQAQRTTVFDLDQAICANDWGEAIGIVGRLVADENTGAMERNNLLTLRRQLEQFRTENVLVADAQACDRTDPYFLASPLTPSVQTGQPMSWERAVAEATNNQYSTEVITEEMALTLPIETGSPAGLTPAAPVDLSQGLSVVSGHVGPGHEVYGFVAGMGDRIEANLEVTRVMAGSLYTSDDSQLFIFDRQGNLIAAADDTSSGQQSRIEGVIVPRTDVYFAVVTSYNNDPILDRDGRLTGWQDNGGGRFDYTLSLSGVTPTSELVR